MSSIGGQSDIDRVRDATDLVHLIGEHITLRPKGREHVGLCPFHDDHKPSFAVVTHKGNAFYKCHSCGAGGDAFDFVRNYHKLDFAEALRYLADRAGIELTPRSSSSRVEQQDDEPSRAELRDANALAAEFFQRVLRSEAAGAAGRAVLEERGISAEMAEQFMLGLAPDQWDSLLNVVRKRSLSERTFAAAGLLKARNMGDGRYDAFRNRLIFPICNEIGQPVAFGARKIKADDEPKYLNSSESAIFQKSRTLYGLHLAKRTIIDTRTAVVTEGYTDVIACHQAGIRSVVGTLGTALTKDHAAMLSRLCNTVVLLFDGDEAGMKAADRGIEAFFAQPVDVRISAIPGGHDPDDLLKQEHGAQRLREVIDSAQDALTYKVARFRNALHSTEGLSARQKLLEGFLAELAELGFASMQGVRKRMVLTQLADLLGLTVDEVYKAMPRPRSSPRSSYARIDARPTGDDALDANIEQDVPGNPSHIAPARLRAEHELLAMILFDGSLAIASIQTCSGQCGAIPSLFALSDFLDDRARAIAERIYAWTEAAEAEHMTMQRLLAQLEDDAAKALASSLYFEGERRLSEVNDSLAELRTAVETLQQHIERDDYRRRVSEFQRTCRDSASSDDHSALSTLEIARELIEHRRRQPTIATAIGRGVRS